MRTEFIRIYKSVHTWTGILCGMALFIAFYAGALSLFKEPIAYWATPPGNNKITSLDDIPKLAPLVIKDHPAAARSFSLHLEGADAARMIWTVSPPDADDHDALSLRHYAASLNAHGQWQAGPAQPTQLAEFIDVLHRVVGLPVDNDPNRWIMGAIASLYLVALVSGVIVLLPSLVKDLFALRVGRNLKRMWLDAHNAVGLLSLPLHLVMALTAVGFAFHDGIYASQNKIIYQGELESIWRNSQPHVRTQATPDPALLLSPKVLLDNVRTLSPGFEPTFLQYQQIATPRAAVRIWGHDVSAVMPRASGGFVVLDPYTGQVLNKTYLPGAHTFPQATLNSIFALHMASFGGLIVKWVYFILALSGAWLFYSGNLLWVESRRRKSRRGEEPVTTQRRDTRLLAAATVGVCIGCICGISLTIASGKWLYGLTEQLTSWHKVVYYTAFFACIGWTLLRGAAKASSQLLWAAAACTLAIPVSSLLAVLAPSFGLWAHTDMSALGVDLTALAGSFCLGQMARATRRRVQHGQPESVWSAPAQAACR